MLVVAVVDPILKPMDQVEQAVVVLQEMLEVLTLVEELVEELVLEEQEMQEVQVLLL